MRKNPSSKSSARPSGGSHFDNLSRPLYQEGLDLFGYQAGDCEPYLELPIKIETRHSARPRRQSDSFSDDLQLDLFREEKPHAPDSEEMAPAQRAYDPIEELLLPLQQAEAGSAPQFQMEVGQAGQLAEEPLDAVEKERLQPSEADNAEILMQKKALLKVMNNFQAYNHSLRIAMNYHTLLKKDAVTKMYGSILGVLNKEGHKMEGALFEEIRTVTAQVRTTHEQEIVVGGRKELQRTMEAEAYGVYVKEEYIE